MKGDQENLQELQLLKGVQTFCKADGLGAVEALCAAVKGKMTSEGWSFRGTCVEPGRDRVASELQKACLSSKAVWGWRQQAWSSGESRKTGTAGHARGNGTTVQSGDCGEGRAHTMERTLADSPSYLLGPSHGPPVLTGAEPAQTRRHSR